jgi:3-isopropylmalate dehydrogenase
LAIVAGDGIGPEVVGEAVKVLDAVLPNVEKSSYDLGARRFHATGEVLPDSVLDELRAHDAILLGAIGDPSVPSGSHQPPARSAVPGCEQSAGGQPRHRLRRRA